MGITIKGGDDFRKKLNEIIEKYPDVMDMALDDTADAISLDAQRTVPVDTGRLRGSINVKREYLKKRIGTNLEYAAFVEYGTPIGTGPHGGPQPYLRPAMIKFGTTATIVKFFNKNL